MTCRHPRSACHRFELHDFVIWSCDACDSEFERRCGLCDRTDRILFPVEGLELCWRCKEALLV
jgi:hypothetical protein